MAVTKSALAAFRSKRARWLLLVSLLCEQMVAWAESSYQLTSHYYNLKPGLTILKPSFDYYNQWSLDTLFNFRFTLDQVSTEDSDVDSMSGASQKVAAEGRTDYRLEYVAVLSHNFDMWKVDLGYLASLEDDYVSHAPSLNVSRDFNQRNTTVSLGYARNFDQVKGEYMSEWKDKGVNNYSLSVTQMLSSTSLAQLGYSVQEAQGYLATGNRQVLLQNDSTIDEYLPGKRTRTAIGVRAAKWFPTETVVQLSAQKYSDSWDVDSTDYSLKLYQKLTSSWKVRGELRHYQQGAAEFVKDSYDGTERYLTQANSLQKFDAGLLGLKLSYQPGEFGNWWLDGKLERYEQSTGLKGNIFMLSGSLLTD